MSDLEFFETSGLRSFVPPNAFDAHAHLYQHKDAAAAVPTELEDPEGNAGWLQYRQATESWMGDRRPEDGLFFPYPRAGNDLQAANRFLKQEIAHRSGSRGLMLVAPNNDAAAVEAEVKRIGWSGFKIYHVYAERERTYDAEIGEFLPDWLWEIAHRHELAIMLHIVRARALADLANQQYLRLHLRRFPGAQLILAHAARGFCGRHTVEGIHALRGLDNVFFDTSAICEPEAFEAIVRVFGPSRLMFGSDFPVSEMSGKCVSINDGFLWLYGDNSAWKESLFAKPRRVGIESLLALRQACQSLHLIDRDVELIFGENARRLLKITNDEIPSDLTMRTYRRARRIIPGGTQLLSKRPEMYAPGRWPAYFREARGCEVIDLDGNKYLDMTTSGIGSCLLGYGDPDVTAAVVRRVTLGSMSTLNSAEEVELAELLVALHPWAEQVRFTRSGGEAMAAAVRIARAATGRDRIAFCGYHGWSDWYLAANLTAGRGGESDPLRPHLLPGLEPLGVPQGLSGTMLPFNYNRLDELERHIGNWGRELAAVVMEPTRAVHPAPGFLEGVRDLCNRHNVPLVFDEISSGWRFCFGGAHLRFGVEPDLAVFAKAISNGHPMGAIIGRRSVMDFAQRTFLSSTYWTEGVGPTAALATLRKMQSIDVPAHAEKLGTLLREGWLELGKRHGLPIKATGHSALLSLGFDHADALALSTFVTQRLLERGILFGGGIYPSLAHEEHHVARLLAAADPVFAELATTIQRGDLLERLGGPEAIRHSGFARLT